MRGQTRRDAISEWLARHGSAKVSELAQLTGSSPVSVRRDLAALEAQGVIRRLHGGAVLASSSGHLPHPHATEIHDDDVPVIGLVVPASGYYFASVLDGIRSAARDMRVRMVLAVSAYSGERERMQIARLVELGASGLIVTPSSTIDVDERTFRDLVDVRIPAVIMEREVNDELRRLDVVRSDHASGALEAFSYFAENGHRGTALISLAETPTIRPLSDGFRRAATLFDNARIETMRFARDPSDHHEADQFLEDALRQCVAIGATSAVVHTDVGAIEFAQIIQARGMQIPHDFSLIAYDDEVAAMADPPLDAIRPPKYAVGRQAVSLLHERMAGSGTAAPRHVTLLPELITRGSTARRS